MVISPRVGEPLPFRLAVSDPDSTSATATLTSLPSHGTLHLLPPSSLPFLREQLAPPLSVGSALDVGASLLVYISEERQKLPNAEEDSNSPLLLNDNFTFTACDDKGACSLSAAAVSVRLLNSLEAHEGEVDSEEEEGRVVRLHGEDSGGQAVHFEITSLPEHASLYQGGGGAACETAPDRFTFRVTDEHGSHSAPATVRVWVGNRNDPPTLLPSPSSAPFERYSLAPLPVLQLADADGDGEMLELTLSASRGFVSLPPPSLPPLWFVEGEGTDDESMRFIGKLSHINEALRGAEYRGLLEGNATLTIAVADPAGAS
ncbi:MAG: hypothetical protein SGPRY_009195 [Prymnesium sp.]